MKAVSKVQIAEAPASQPGSSSRPKTSLYRVHQPRSRLWRARVIKALRSGALISYSSHTAVTESVTDSVQRAFSIQLSLVADQPRRRCTSVGVMPRPWRCSVSLRARARLRIVGLSPVLRVWSMPPASPLPVRPNDSAVTVTRYLDNRLTDYRYSRYRGSSRQPVACGAGPGPRAVPGTGRRK